MSLSPLTVLWTNVVTSGKVVVRSRSALTPS